jgi:hypothetical protein
MTEPEEPLNVRRRRFFASLAMMIIGVFFVVQGAEMIIRHNNFGCATCAMWGFILFMSGRYVYQLRTVFRAQSRNGGNS